ncbi:MAG: phosphotransferase [Planctomycetota bacterium]
MNGDPDATINAVLRHWGLDAAVVEAGPADNRGFSGTAVWRVRRGQECFALRRLSDAISDAKHVSDTHRLIRYAARVLDYVPWPRSTSDGQTIAFEAGRFWSLETWLPGEACETVRTPDIEMAATALWMLHEVTHDSTCFGRAEQEGPCQAVRRRSDILQNAEKGFESIAGDVGRVGVELPQARRVVELLPAAIQRVAPLVDKAGRVAVRQQPIVGDVRRPDVLFTRGRVTGIVDFGAATFDSPVVDLTRMLGEFAGEQVELWQAGLAAYQLRRELAPAERQLIPALDAGGVVAAALNWLRWLGDGTVRPTAQVARRLDVLISRLEPITAGNVVAKRAFAGESA